jgi:hypothetical protein
MSLLRLSFSVEGVPDRTDEERRSREGEKLVSQLDRREM